MENTDDDDHQFDPGKDINISGYDFRWIICNHKLDAKWIAITGPMQSITITPPMKKDGDWSASLFVGPDIKETKSFKNPSKIKCEITHWLLISIPEHLSKKRIEKSFFS